MGTPGPPSMGESLEPARLERAGTVHAARQDAALPGQTRRGRFD